VTKILSRCGLNQILGRTRNERPFLVLVVGYPAEGDLTPDIRRRPFEDVVTFL
jgi:iodotyrosine deiodinase